MNDHTTDLVPAWNTELRPDAYGKKLYITLANAEGLLDFQLREYIASKTADVREYLDEQAHAGNERHCTIDHHAMQKDLYSVVLLGNLHDLEHLQEHFYLEQLKDRSHTAPKAASQPVKLRAVADTAAGHAQLPTARTTQRSHLRLVVSDGVAVV